MDDDQVPRHTVAKVAEQLGRSVATVRSIVCERDIGTLVNARMRLLSDADVIKLKAVIRDGRGRPPKASQQ